MAIIRTFPPKEAYKPHPSVKVVNIQEKRDEKVEKQLAIFTKALQDSKKQEKLKASIKKKPVKNAKKTASSKKKPSNKKNVTFLSFEPPKD